MKYIVCVAALLLCFCNMAWCEEQEEFPLGYPFTSWGEITETPVGRQETGFKVDGYVEQGIDWLKLGKTDWKFNTFVGLRGTASSRPIEYFNNKVGPWAGFKFKRILDFGGDNSGSFYLGVRWEQYHYFGSAPPVIKDHHVLPGLSPRDDNRVTFFFEWGFDGDWKRKNNGNNKENHGKE